MNTLIRALSDYDIDLLRIIAAQWGIALSTSDRQAAAEELAAAMRVANSVQSVWAHLSADEQGALHDLVAHEGRIPYFHFVRRYGEIRPMGPARREREKPWLSPDSVTESLYYWGVITRTFAQTPAGTQEYIALPRDMLELWPRPENGALIGTPGYPVAPPRRFTSDHPLAPDDMSTLLSYLLLRETNAREWLHKVSVEVIDRHLRRPYEYACRAMLIQLLYDLDLITDETLLTQITTHVNKDATRPWLEAPRIHQVRSLAEAWRDSVNWNELAYTPGLESENWPNDPRLARQTVLAAMQKIPVEIWWSMDGFVEHIKQTNPDFQRPGGDYGGWFLRDSYTGETMHGFQYWDSIEGALIRFIIEGPMSWLGLVRVGRGAFLLTEAGLALLSRIEWPARPDPPTRIRIDEQGVISVPVQLSRYDRAQIARFAAWIGAPPPAIGNTDEGIYQYRLTPQAISRVASDGITLMQHIMPFLQRLSGQNIPPNVQRMLQSWDESPKEVIVEDVVIVRVRDLQVYERLHRNERVSRWMGQAVAPQAHVVRREDFPALLNALRQMGVLPLFEGHEKDNWP